MTLVLRLGDDLGPLVEALRRGRPTVIPTDTVYGLATGAAQAAAYERLVRLKGREPAQPSALLCGTVEALLTAVLPDLPPADAERARRLLPGPVTLVVSNPSRRFPWLCGATPERIGVRVPVLDRRLAAALDAAGGVAATSANPTGQPAPHRLEEVDRDLLAAVDVALDGGPAGGAASTVIDLTGPEPVILRAGPVDEAEVRRRLGVPPRERAPAPRRER